MCIFKYLKKNRGIHLNFKKSPKSAIIPIVLLTPSVQFEA